MGVSDEYCLICGCPINIMDDDDNIKIKKNKKDYGWLENLFFINNQNKIFKMNGKNYDDSGNIFDKNKTYRINNLLWHDEDDENYGVCIHQDCYQLLFKKLHYKLMFAHICRYLQEYNNLLRIKYKPIEKFIGQQSFEFNKISSDFLQSPLKNKINADRILGMWKPLSIKFNKDKIRNSPCESATKFKNGKILHGNDGKKYITKKDKNGVNKWVLY